MRMERLLVAFTGAELPKLLWLLFAVCNFVNAFLIITNYKKPANKKSRLN